jgi:hypothetical protein
MQRPSSRGDVRHALGSLERRGCGRESALTRAAMPAHFGHTGSITRCQHERLHSQRVSRCSEGLRFVRRNGPRQPSEIVRRGGPAPGLQLVGPLREARAPDEET